jgi:hypothetical protein
MVFSILSKHVVSASYRHKQQQQGVIFHPFILWRRRREKKGLGNS